MRAKRARQSDPSKAIGYVRVSTDEQSLSPEAQIERLSLWCTENGIELVAVFSDIGVSGAAPIDKRPGLLSALDALASHRAGALLVAKRDRLARDVMVCALVERLCERTGARVLSADGTGNEQTPEGMLLRGLVDLFAMYERALIRSRTAAALAVKRSRGERTGQIPYGYRLAADGVHLETDPDEQAICEQIGELRSLGLSLAQIAERLNGASVPARGARWYPMSVSRAVERLAA